MQKKKKSVFKLEIGGLIISIKDNTSTATLRAPYQNFYSDGTPDLELQIHHKSSVHNTTMNYKCFDADQWKMFHSRDGYILKLSSIIAVLKPDFKFGDIYFKTKNMQIASPLGYPLGELILINLLARSQGLLVHSCGIKVGKESFLFAGKSGAGKSTISKLFNDNKVHVLNDDRTIIRKRKNEVRVFGTPWHGDAKLFSNKSAPLKKIFFLRHGEKNELKPINPTQAAALLVARSFPPYWDAEGIQNILDLSTEIAQTIPCYELSFVQDKSVVDFILNLN